jgi:RNA polymerase sigma-70 factor (ECF subfamily)
MLEDRLLVRKLRHGNKEALRRIYEKYKDELLALGTALSHDRAAAEDIVHDVFVSFAEIARSLELKGSLRSYLAVSVANRVRNLARSQQGPTSSLDEARTDGSASNNPAGVAVAAEEFERIGKAMRQLPYAQREVLILHLQAGMKFRVIAETLGVSINTVQARYRYGLDKLRSMLNSEMAK